MPSRNIYNRLENRDEVVLDVMVVRGNAFVICRIQNGIHEFDTVDTFSNFSKQREVHKVILSNMKIQHTNKFNKYYNKLH